MRPPPRLSGPPEMRTGRKNLRLPPRRAICFLHWPGVPSARVVDCQTSAAKGRDPSLKRCSAAIIPTSAEAARKPSVIGIPIKSPLGDRGRPASCVRPSRFRSAARRIVKQPVFISLSFILLKKQNRSGVSPSLARGIRTGRLLCLASVCRNRAMCL